mmetsp:Transcript_17566/g.35649  ORF Transcript_17566/g.35649 Transcript_17566/m.35649 type:complete len:132 (-) Transcript_17566:458-853(-)
MDRDRRVTYPRIPQSVVRIWGVLVLSDLQRNYSQVGESCVRLRSTVRRKHHRKASQGLVRPTESKFLVEQFPSLESTAGCPSSPGGCFSACPSLHISLLFNAKISSCSDCQGSSLAMRWRPESGKDGGKKL